MVKETVQVPDGKGGFTTVEADLEDVFLEMTYNSGR